MRTFIANGLLVFTLAFSLVFSLVTHAKPVNVSVITPTLHTKKLELELSGNVEALNDAQLTSLESGVVNAILVDAGDDVEKGQPLIKLDNVLALIELEQAKAAYQSANVKYKEDLRLYNEIVELTKQKVIAKTIFAERKSNLANSKALLSQAKAKQTLQQEIVNRHVLVAPFTGTISQRNVDVGEWISQQSQILRLVSNNALRIFVDIPQEYFNQVKSANNIKALITPDSFSSQTIALSVSKFINVSHLNSRTFKARIDLPTNTPLVSGMSAKVKLVLPNLQGTLAHLPKSVLKRHPDGNYSVFTVKNNKIQRQSVKLLSSQLDQVLVQGVNENTAIVISGSNLLKEGMPVTITNKEAN